MSAAASRVGQRLPRTRPGRRSSARSSARDVGEARLGEVGAQIVGERRDVGVAIVGPARQRARDDARQHLVDAAADGARIGELPLGDPPQHLVRVLAGERQLAGRQLVEHDPDGEDVGAEVERLALDDLGRHVGRRSEELAR